MMKLEISSTKQLSGEKAAADAARAISGALAERGAANVILATGASQFEMLGVLAEAALDWRRVSCFHLDEYIGMPTTHPASFCKYLQERFVDVLPRSPAAFHFVDGLADPQAECDRLGGLIAEHPIDVAMIGIGENGHLAFNDPPADFQTDAAYLVVELDEACRRQQFGEGWFPTLDDVPTQAISMSIPQIMRSRRIICTVPDERKARAVQAAVEGPVTPDVPASILQRHAAATLYLDEPAASLLTR